MDISASVIIVTCEDTLCVQLSTELRMLTEHMVGQYQGVINGDGAIDNVRTWCDRAESAFKEFGQRGDPVSVHRLVLREARERCEKLFLAWRESVE